MLAKKKVYRRLWAVVRELIKANYELIAVKSVAGIRGSRSMTFTKYSFIVAGFPKAF